MSAPDIVRHVFVSPDGVMRPNWLAAFPSAMASTAVPLSKDVDMLWLLLPDEGDVAALVAATRQKLPGKPIVALADVPEDAQGLRALGSGAVGYCNGRAMAEVLTQVVASIQSGGVWVGPSLMQRLVSGVVRRNDLKSAQPAAPEVPAWQTLLTEREIEVANELTQGSTNKEIANRLLISERTVKAHLGSVFDKLKVRDRLQLILLVKSSEHA